MKSQQDNMQQGDKSQMVPEGVGPSSGSVTRGSQGSGLKRAFSESDHPSLIKMSQNARASMGVLGQGLKQLFQQQRKRLSLSRSTITSSSSSSSSSVVSACGTSPCAPEDASESCCPDSDIFSAPMVPSAAGQGSAAAGMMRRGTSLQSRRSKGSGSGSGSGDRDPLLKGSPQAPQRRYTHDPQQHISRPRSSSTTDTTPSSPAPGYSSGDALLSSGYQSTEETDRIDRLEVSGLGQAPLSVSCGADSSFQGGEDITPDPHRTKQAIAQLQQKILKLTEQIKIEQTARDDNVAEYLKLANNADKQQSTRIKQVFEKKNQKSAQTIQQLQRKLEHYHRRLREAEHNGIPRQPKDVLRDMQQGLKDVGAKVTGFSEGVVDSVKGGLSSFSQATHSAAGAVVSKPREIASLIRNKFGSADNISSLKDSLDDPSVEEGVTSTGGRSLGSTGHHFQSSPKYGSEDDCSSATSGSVGANSTTGAPGGPPSSKGNTLERSQSSSFDMLLQEVQELRDGQARLEESLEGLKSHYQRDYTVVMQALQEERFRCERLEEQLNDLTELHQNEILNLKQELASMEEKIAYQSYERARDIQEALEACQTRISKMELQQQQQQVVQLEGLENATARTLLGKLINVLLALMAVLLVFVSTVANCVVPLMKTRSRSLSTLLLILLLAFLWRNWDALSGYTHRALQPPG
ncbi:transmembrane and coiled-coil domains protein 1 isoform X1 [Haplochromis burtoni]|uniref:Transmembrane and coiled-coil domain family 1 n=2 Tax=Haplochromis burtoni TaxID=8153 RepID=A0A3Q2XH94_HAPBU|nr:transmembrane and coiled-coil domains protein 1 isoform X1 [Haplochromis burtoni]XP_014194443.1 transmembrane and coiled-coil domains protein 1 isoform X1 [Haplochromis burtoni]XP_014194444.1 transmembrane and coiled-coil domains protein 1 isoform X1 [Haplochromis burtoni]XP_042083201.1 transmembrane and coiled-coil domains protein 1 isoform X1 [Haplochromis burtoni]XP_042083202.1 transmembrane and coiled-coil domains protein 1 isoform X1 [Haplochromis burtoni]